jgi:hypothetical protein
VFKNHRPPHESQVKKPVHISTDFFTRVTFSQKLQRRLCKTGHNAWLEESCTFFSPKKLEEDLGKVMHARTRVSRNCALLQQQQQEKHNCTIFLEKHSRVDVMHFTKLWRVFKGPRKK